MIAGAQARCRVASCSWQVPSTSLGGSFVPLAVVEETKALQEYLSYLER